MIDRKEFELSEASRPQKPSGRPLRPLDPLSYKLLRIFCLTGCLYFLGRGVLDFTLTKQLADAGAKVQARVVQSELTSSGVKFAFAVEGAPADKLFHDITIDDQGNLIKPDEILQRYPKGRVVQGYARYNLALVVLDTSCQTAILLRLLQAFILFGIAQVAGKKLAKAIESRRQALSRAGS